MRALFCRRLREEWWGRAVGDGGDMRHYRHGSEEGYWRRWLLVHCTL
jgi:hypothetical protein